MKIDKRLITTAAGAAGALVAAWIWAPANISVSGFRFLIVFCGGTCALITAGMTGLLDD